MPDKAKLWAVMRKPILPEDEGRVMHYGHFPSEDAAKQKIQEETKDGFFKSQDFYIISFVGS